MDDIDWEELNERIARGEFPKAPPSQDDLPRFETDDETEAARSLEKLAEELERSKTDPYAWKWAIIALHNAVQASIVRIISGGDQTGALREKEQKETRAWLRAQLDGTAEDGEWPDPYLAYFMVLYKRAKERRPTAKIAAALDEDMEKLNAYRNKLIHFTPMQWTLLLWSMPQRVLRVLDFVESILPSRPTGGTQWIIEDNGFRAERGLEDARRIAAELDARFNPPEATPPSGPAQG